MQPSDGTADDHHLGGCQLSAEGHEATGQEDEQSAASQRAVPMGYTQQWGSPYGPICPVPPPYLP